MVWPLSSDTWKAPYIRKGYYFVMKRSTKEVLSVLSKMVYIRIRDWTPGRSLSA